MTRNKTLQIRFSEEELNTIKKAFNNRNISEVVRNFLLEQAEGELEANEFLQEELKEEQEILRFKRMLENEEVLNYLYNAFKGV